MSSMLYEIAAVCSTDTVLSTQMIEYIDTLAHNYGGSYDSQQTLECLQAWEFIEGSVQFWANIDLLLKQTQHSETALQTLILIEKRVRNSWMQEDPTIRMSLKAYLSTEAQKYSQGIMTQTRKSLFRKINSTIVEILKYEWFSEWEDFLKSICTAINQNPDYSENYFDLLSVIFQEIFTDDNKLTVSERKKIRQEIGLNYGIIHKTFETYLIPEYPSSTLRNAIGALCNLIPWIPTSFIYFGFIVDKIIILFLNLTELKTEALRCLSVILETPCDSSVEGSLAKLYVKKRQILICILDQKELAKQGVLTESILQTSLKFLQLQEIDITKYTQNNVFADQASVASGHQLIDKLLEWAQLIEGNQELQLKLLKYLTVLTSPSDMACFRKVVNLAPCPIKTTFYDDENIVKSNLEEQQLESDRQIYKQIIKNLSINHQQAYFSSFNKILSYDFYSNAIGLKFLNKVIWNFNYFQQVCSESNGLKMKTYAVLNELVKIQTISQENGMKNNKNSSLMAKRGYSLKIGQLIIVCQQKAIKQQFSQKFIRAIFQSSFYQSNNYVRAVFTVIQSCYHHFNQRLRQSIDEDYRKHILNRESRFQIDKQYIKVIGEWVKSKPSAANMQEGLKYGLAVIRHYRNKFSKANSQIIKNRNNLESMKADVCNSCFDYMQILQLAFPYFKRGLILETDGDLQLILKVRTAYDLMGRDQKSISFYQVLSKVCASYFWELTPNEYASNVESLMKQANQICAFVLQSMQKNTICPQILSSWLDYLGRFINKMGNIEMNNQMKSSATAYIVKMMMNRNFRIDTPGFTTFIQHIVQSNCLPILEPELTEYLMDCVFAIANSGGEDNIQISTNMLVHIITKSVNVQGYFELITKYALSFIGTTFKFMLREKPNCELVRQYTRVLFLYLSFAKTHKFNLNPEQMQQNLNILYSELFKIAKQMCYGHQEAYYLQLKKLTDGIIRSTYKPELEQITQDLLVMVNRGY